MKKILIVGNSSSGKSTYAKELVAKHNLSHLDLDTVAWRPVNPPVRKPLIESVNEIMTFIHDNENWVIEGCYTFLMDAISEFSNELIYMNTPVDACIKNAKMRPWEPHKYESKKAQDENLNMLIEWIKEYDYREGELSKKSHETFFNAFDGRKSMVTSQN